MFNVGDQVKLVFVFNPENADAVLTIKQRLKVTNKRNHVTSYHYYFENNPWHIEHCSESNLTKFIPLDNTT